MSKSLVRGRRSFRWLAVLLALVLVAAACGDDGGSEEAEGDPGDGNGESTTTTTGEDGESGMPDDLDPDGILQWGTTLTGTGGPPHLDPVESQLISDYPYMQLIYGSIMQQNPDGSHEPWLVADLTVVDPQTIEITTRDDVFFSDGTPYDAEAVAAGLTRTRFESDNPAVEAGMHAAFKQMESAEALDEDTVEIKLAVPIAGDFVASLARREGSIVSPTQVAEAPETIATDPVGAGPYMLEELDPNRILSVRKNPDHFEADRWLLGGVDFIHTPSGPTGVNGLLAGTLDYYEAVPLESLDPVEAAGDLEVRQTSTDFAYRFLNFCSVKPPFDDVNVRRAFQLAIDRQELIDLGFDGHGEVAYGLWPEGHVNFNEDLKDVNVYDPEQAAELFEGAGITPDTPLTVEISNTASQGNERILEVFQSQLGEYGVDVELRFPNNVIAEFIDANIPGALYTPGSRTGFDKYGRVFLPGAQQDLCDAGGQPEVMELVAEAASHTPGSEESAAAYKAADALIIENAYLAPYVFVPTPVAWNTDRIGGDPQFNGSHADLIVDTIYIRG